MAQSVQASAERVAVSVAQGVIPGPRGKGTRLVGTLVSSWVSRARNPPASGPSAIPLEEGRSDAADVARGDEVVMILARADQR